MRKCVGGRSGLLFFVGVVITSLSLVSVNAWGQSAAGSSLNGKVMDSAGAVIPGAVLKLTNLATRQVLSTTSGVLGDYAFAFLSPGKYELTAIKPGFANITVSEIVLQVSVDSTVQVKMKPATTEENITVSVSANQVNTVDSTVTRSVTNDQVRGLPVIATSVGRTVLDQLIFLVPGTQPNSPLGTGNRAENVSINGGRPSSISFNFDGGDNNDHENNRAASPLPNPDVIQEFTVVTNNYKAELGRSSSGIVNAVSKSGTDQMHGMLRYYLSNEALDATPFLHDQKDRHRLNTFGGQLGGPVWIPGVYRGTSKTHFLFDFETTRTGVTNDFSRDLLSLKERVGDFSSLPMSQWPRDPAGPRDASGRPTDVFPNGIIPADRISPIATKYLQLIPEPNSGDRNYRARMPYDERNTQYTIRIDHNLSRADNISGTYFRTKVESLSTSTTNVPIGSHQDSISDNHNFVLRETHVFSNRVVNQFTGTVTRFTNGLEFYSPGASGVAPEEFGFANIRPQTTGRFYGLPSLTITGTGVQVTSGGGSFQAKTAWQLKDDIAISAGNHDLKFGGEVLGFIFNKLLGHNNGSFNFRDANVYGSGNSVADFLLGVPNTYSQSTGNFFYPRQKAYYVYGQTDWRVKPNLVLNLGLRYEIVPPLVDELDQMAVFRPGYQSSRLPQAPLGVLYVGDRDPILGTVPRGTYRTDRNNFAPRIGFAYSPSPQSGPMSALFGDGKSSIRGAWGVFYDQTYGFSGTQQSFTPPFSVTESLTAVQIYDGGGNFADPFGTIPNLWPLNLESRKFPATPPTIQPFDPNFRTAYTYQYNLTIQRELPWKMMFEIGYIGSNAFKLNRERQANPSPLTPTATASNVSARRTYPTIGNVPLQESTGRARYDSLQTRLVRRFASGLAFDGSYVYGRMFDNGSNPQVSQLVLTDPNRWAPSSNNRTHNFVISYTYDLPKFSRFGPLNKIINGWAIGGITQIRSGLPLDISQTTDTRMTGEVLNGRGNPDLVGEFVTFDPHKERTIIWNGVPITAHFFFDPNAFQVVTAANGSEARAGTLGRNKFTGPMFNMTSLSLLKRTQITERQAFELRADFSNFFNHTNFSFPGLIVNSTGFGYIQYYQVGDPRQIQVSARYSF